MGYAIQIAVCLIAWAVTIWAIIRLADPEPHDDDTWDEIWDRINEKEIGGEG